ncbi:hypothetical protein B586_12040 [Mycobacterium haemophilum DSM 44634]|nr:hypothetical protein B586_12040 [Mycobacterium haemophilum DSM 44634]
MDGEGPQRTAGRPLLLDQLLVLPGQMGHCVIHTQRGQREGAVGQAQIAHPAIVTAEMRPDGGHLPGRTLARVISDFKIRLEPNL